MLDGDHSLFVAPCISFERELVRMNLAPSRLQIIKTAHNDFASQSQDAEISDLIAALKKQKTPETELERIRAAHETEREKIKKYVADFEKWEGSGTWSYDDNGRHYEKPSTPPPRFPVIEVVKGLPGEFEDYFDGAVVWRNPALLDKSMAREPWERLLARPAAERKFKSTWAAFMLGRSWETNNADKALAYYKQTRELARSGFTDSLGLAAASLGQEARVHLHKKDFPKAIQLYLEQFATGEPSAITSLQQVSAQVLEDPEMSRAVAKDDRSRRAITAFLLSRDHTRFDDEAKRELTATTNWLAAVEAAGIADVESAEKLALAAYQVGDYDAAQQWIRRAKNSPVAQWLQAKLHLRAGKIEPAAALLAKISRSFPLAFPGTNGPANFAEGLYVVGQDATSAGQQILGEIGALRLVRRDFVQSLDALVRSGYWQDAAYVGERVLTVDELKKYVDENWPAVAAKSSEAEANADAPDGNDNARKSIRHLLARRLTRLSRGNEAPPYCQEEFRPQLTTFLQSLETGGDENQSPEIRARALFQAATIARTNGMELLGTEVGPDWAVIGGDFDFGDSLQYRTNTSLKILLASPEERRRAMEHCADPEERFHYRYQAATLAWDAAKLMPDNSDETARMLCTGGTWLKVRDPDKADVFYKTLVRRCRKTAIGAQADRMRWFPVLDENGNPKPYRPPPKSAAPEGPESSTTEPEANPAPTFAPYYTVQAGDSLPRIAWHLSLFGPTISVQDLMTANPNLDPLRLKIGDVLSIPTLAAETNAPAK